MIKICRFNRSVRIYINFAVIIVGFFVLFGFIFVDTKNSNFLKLKWLYLVPQVYFGVTITIVILLSSRLERLNYNKSVSSSFIQAIFIGLMGFFPSVFTNFYLFGQVSAFLIEYFVIIILMLFSTLNLKILIKEWFKRCKS